MLILIQGTDICQHALDMIAESKIRRVQIVGRRGPLQVSFTIKELREMTKLPGCRPVLSPHDFDPIRDLLKGDSYFTVFFNSMLHPQLPSIVQYLQHEISASYLLCHGTCSVQRRLEWSMVMGWLGYEISSY